MIGVIAGFLIIALMFTFFAYFIRQSGKTGNSPIDSHKPIVLLVDDSPTYVSCKEMGFWAVRISDKESHRLLDSMKDSKVANDFITYFITVALQSAIYRYHVVKVLGFGGEALHDMKIGENDSINTFTMGNGEKVPDELCRNFSSFVDFFSAAIQDDFNGAMDRMGVFERSKISITFDAMLDKYNKKYVEVDALDRMMIGQVLNAAVVEKMKVLNGVIRRR